MRHACFLLPVLASFTLSIQPADACGPYGGSPQLLQLSTHYATEGTRMFALTTEEVTGDHAWVRLAPRTYDNAAVVDVADPVRARDFTLVGPQDTRIVSSRKRFLIKETFLGLQPAVAFEMPVKRDGFRIALAGKHADATWTDREPRAVTAADRAWVNAQGLPTRFFEIHALAGTGFELVSVIVPEGMVTLVRRGDHLHTRFDGHALGLLSVDGEQFVVGANGGPARAIRI